MPTSSVEDIIAQSGGMEDNSGEDPLLSLPDVQGLKLSTNSNWENEDGLTVDGEEGNENGTQKHTEDNQEKEASDNEQQQEEENEKNEGEEQTEEEEEEVQEQAEGGNENDNGNHAQNDEEESEATQSDSRGGSPPALPTKSQNNGSTPSRMSYRSRTTPTPNHLSRSPTKSPSKFSPNSSLTSTGLFEFTRAESPGPGTYDILRTPTPNSSTKRHSFSSSLSSRFQSTKSISPGPGYYTPPMPKEKNIPRVSMSVPNLRLHNPMFSSGDKTPGPGTYDYDLFCTARRLSSGPSFPFKSVTPRGNLLNGAILKTPGPGFYNPNESLKHSPVTSFTANKPAKRSKTSPTLTPGPGAYDPPKPAIPSFTISKKAKTANHISPLGPGFYDAQKPAKTAPAYSMGVRRPFVVERVLPHNSNNKTQDPPLPLTQYPPRQKGAKFSATVYEKPAPKQSQSIPSITASSIQLGMDSSFTVATTAS